LGGYLGQGLADGGDQLCRRARFGAPKQRFDLAPHLLDGIEIRRVGRQEEPPGSGVGDQGQRRVAFVGGEIVEDDEVPGRNVGTNTAPT